MTIQFAPKQLLYATPGGNIVIVDQARGINIVIERADLDDFIKAIENERLLLD